MCGNHDHQYSYLETTISNVGLRNYSNAPTMHALWKLLAAILVPSIDDATIEIWAVNSIKKSSSSYSRLLTERCLPSILDDDGIVREKGPGTRRNKRDLGEQCERDLGVDMLSCPLAPRSNKLSWATFCVHLTVCAVCWKRICYLRIWRLDGKHRPPGS